MTITKVKRETGLLTADDLLRLYSEGVRGELIRGVLCETMPGGREHGRIAAQLCYLLVSFIRPRRLGWVMGTDAGVWLERDPDTVREPDVAFFAAGNYPAEPGARGYAEAIPDLVVEIASPNDSAREVEDKARMWLSFGVRLVWVAYPDTRSVVAHPLGGEARALGADDTLDGGDVLPGFSCKVGDVFDVF